VISSMRLRCQLHLVLLAVVGMGAISGIGAPLEEQAAPAGVASQASQAAAAATESPPGPEPQSPCTPSVTLLQPTAGIVAGDAAVLEYDVLCPQGAPGPLSLLMYALGTPGDAVLRLPNALAYSRRPIALSALQPASYVFRLELLSGDHPLHAELFSMEVVPGGGSPAMNPSYAAASAALARQMTTSRVDTPQAPTAPVPAMPVPAPVAPVTPTPLKAVVVCGTGTVFDG
jgi:hypothetical protein